MIRFASILRVGLWVPALVIICGCNLGGERVTTGELQTETKTVSVGAAHNVNINLNMKAGGLNVRGGAPDLLNADFAYNVPAWKPDLKYEVNGASGILSVEQPGSGSSTTNTRNEWNLRLNNKVPMELSVNMGAGRAELSLAGLALSRMELNMGAGDVTVDLTGDWKKDVDAKIHGGVGRATIRLPQTVGVHVVAQGGLGAINANDFQKDGGAYVNSLYGKSPVTLRVEVEGGVGEINLELRGETPAN